MKSSLTMLKRAVPLACAALAFAGSAQAALQDRDLDGDTVVDAFYDTDLDITWLRDANVIGVGTYWTTAVAWADLYSFGGYDAIGACRRATRARASAAPAVRWGISGTLNLATRWVAR
jgi:hypothetical protein